MADVVDVKTFIDSQDVASELKKLQVAFNEHVADGPEDEVDVRTFVDANDVTSVINELLEKLEEDPVGYIDSQDVPSMIAEIAGLINAAAE